MNKCNICSASTTNIIVKEQMMGLHESFTYAQCTECGHTHLTNIPEKMNKYYSEDIYYSFTNTNNIFFRIIEKMINFLNKISLQIRLKNNFTFSSPLKAILSIKAINKKLRILDYGCGAGQFISELRTLGFQNSYGYDPFLTNNEYKNGEIYLSNKLELMRFKKWDVIILNHVFEHLDNPIEKLDELSELIDRNGKLILRFPVIDSFAFEKYRENWVQFDAPRHINLFTRKSIKSVIGNSKKYKLISLYDDSYHFQFSGSELYLKKLSLSTRNNNRLKRYFSSSTYKYHFMAKRLNKLNKGDQIVVILEKTRCL